MRAARRARGAARPELEPPCTRGGIGYAPCGRDVEMLRAALLHATAALAWPEVERATGVPADGARRFALGGAHRIRQDWFDVLWAWTFHWTDGRAALGAAGKE